MTEVLERPEEWTVRAACLNEDPDLFWLDQEDPAAVRSQKARTAKKICEECPVWVECRRWGMEKAPEDRWSILGGLTYRERRLLRQERWNEQPAAG